MSFFDGLAHKARVLFRGERYAQEQEDELRVHLELESMQHRSGGAPPGLAGAAARRRLGNLTAIREELRRAAGLAFVDRARQDLGYALRGLRRSPGFTATVVLTLALGLGANAAIFSFLDRVFARSPDGVASPGAVRRLYVQSHDFRDPAKTVVLANFNYPSYEAIRDGSDRDALLAAFTPPENASMRLGDTSVRAAVSWVTPQYFPMLGVRLEHGRMFADDEGRIEIPAPVAIISHAFWRTAFALDPDIVGKVVAVGRQAYTIIGVAAPGFAGIDVDVTDLFAPLNMFPAPAQRQAAWYRGFGGYLRIIARPRPQSDIGALLLRGTVAYNRQPSIAGFSFDSTSAMLAGPLAEARGPGDHSQEVSISTRIAGVALVVLLIACANVANLLLVRATRRRREIAVRLALGVSRSRLYGQLLIESMLLAGIAGTVAVGVAWWGGTTLRTLLLPNVHWSSGVLDARLLAFLTATTMLAGVAAGLAPVFLAQREDVVDALKGSARAGTYRRSRLRSTLVVAQTALSVVLVCGAGLFVRSLGNVSTIKVGYDTDSLAFATVALSDASSIALVTQVASAITSLAASLKSEPGVLGTAYTSAAPMRGWTGIPISVVGRDSIPRLGTENPYPQMNWVSADFFRTVGTPIVAGRAFAENEPSGMVIVNETMASALWPGETALGKCIYVSQHATGPCSMVVGVSANAHRWRIIEEPNMQFFMSHGPARALIIRVDPGQWATVSARARTELRRLLPASATVSVSRMRTYLDREMRPWQLGASLFTVFGLLALIVAAIGVYSVIAYAVSQRTREMGVRIALGARLRDVVQLIVGEGLRVIAFGILLGVGIALALGKLVASLLYGVTPRDPFVIVGATALLLVVGVAASLMPAWRAARVEPMTSLRTD